MKSVIFKSEKKAKNYEVRCSKVYNTYVVGELIRRVRTDSIWRAITESEYGNVTITQID